MYTLTITFPDSHKEKMFLRKMDCTDDVLNALRSRGTLHVNSIQLDIEDYFNEGTLFLSDAITGDHLISVHW